MIMMTKENEIFKIVHYFVQFVFFFFILLSPFFWYFAFLCGKVSKVELNTLEKLYMYVLYVCMCLSGLYYIVIYSAFVYNI